MQLVHAVPLGKEQRHAALVFLDRQLPSHPLKADAVEGWRDEAQDQPATTPGTSCSCLLLLACESSAQ